MSFLLLKKKKKGYSKKKLECCLHITNIDDDIILSTLLRILSGYGKILRSSPLSYGGGNYKWTIVEFENKEQAKNCFSGGGFKLGKRRVKISLTRHLDSVIFEDVVYPIQCSCCKGDAVKRTNQIPCPCGIHNEGCTDCFGTGGIGVNFEVHSVCESCFGECVERESSPLKFPLEDTLLILSSCQARYLKEAGERKKYSVRRFSCPSVFSFFNLNRPSYEGYISSRSKKDSIVHVDSVDMIMNGASPGTFFTLEDELIRMYDVSKSILFPSVLIKGSDFTSMDLIKEDRILVSGNKSENRCGKVEVYNLKTGKAVSSKEIHPYSDLGAREGGRVASNLCFGVKHLSKERFLTFPVVDVENDLTKKLGEYRSEGILCEPIIFDYNKWKQIGKITPQRYESYSSIEYDTNEKMIICGGRGNSLDLFDMRTMAMVEEFYLQIPIDYQSKWTFQKLKSHPDLIIAKTHQSIYVHDKRKSDHVMKSWKYMPSTNWRHQILPNQYPQIVDIGMGEFVTSHGGNLAIWNLEGENRAKFQMNDIEGKNSGFHSIPLFLGDSKAGKLLPSEKGIGREERVEFMKSFLEKDVEVKCGKSLKVFKCLF